MVFLRVRLSTPVKYAGPEARPCSECLRNPSYPVRLWCDSGSKVDLSMNTFGATSVRQSFNLISLSFVNHVAPYFGFYSYECCFFSVNVPPR
jgi:hypothetical protein